MKIQYVISRGTDPYQNIAMEHLLLSEAGPGCAILFFWQNEHTIVIGRNQIPQQECDLDRFAGEKGTLARRLSGGGAVYHDMGNLNVSLIGRSTEIDRSLFSHLFMQAQKELGIQAEFNGRNDFLVNGRKFCGYAAYEENGVLCQHCAILVRCDLNKMERYLTPSYEKLQRNCVKSVRARVMNLAEIRPELSIAELSHAWIRAAAALPLERLPSEEAIRKESETFRDRQWIFEGEK